MTDNLKEILVTGLTSSPKYIPIWYIYDDVGSTIQYRSVTENPDYYITRGEVSILERNLQAMMRCNKQDLTLVDLGKGGCSKTRLVIEELLKRQKTVRFYPVDISEEFLMKAVESLSEEYDDSLLLQAIAAAYAQGICQLKGVKGIKIILWFGSIINLPYDDQVNILRLISTMMTDKCRLIFKADVTQDRESIMNAYKDDAGLIQEFNQHAIVRLNKEEGSEIDLAKFTYELDFISDNNPQYMSYTRVYITAKETTHWAWHSTTDMEKGERLYFHKGDAYSCKYTMEQLRTLSRKLDSA